MLYNNYNLSNDMKILALRKAFDNKELEPIDKENLRRRRSFLSCFEAGIVRNTRSEIYWAVMQAINAGLERNSLENLQLENLGLGISRNNTLCDIRNLYLSEIKNAILMGNPGQLGRAYRHEMEIIIGKLSLISAPKHLVLDKVKQDGMSLRFAAIELKRDRQVVIAAVMQNSIALKFASEELKCFRLVVGVAVAQGGMALRYASEELRADRSIVLVAVGQDGMALRYASEELRADRSIVLVAVRQNGIALKYASEELRADRDFMLDAVKTNPNALKYASYRIQADPELRRLAASHIQDNYAKFCGIVSAA